MEQRLIDRHSNRNLWVLVATAYGYVIVSGHFGNDAVNAVVAPCVALSMAYFVFLSLVFRAWKLAVLLTVGSLVVLTMGTLAGGAWTWDRMMAFALHPLTQQPLFVILFSYFQLPMLFLVLSIDLYELQYEIRPSASRFFPLRVLLYAAVLVVGLRDRLLLRTEATMTCLFERGADCKKLSGRLIYFPEVLIPVVRSAIIESVEMVDRQRMMNVSGSVAMSYNPPPVIMSGRLPIKLAAMVFVGLVIMRGLK